MTIETRASWAVCLTALGIAAVFFAALAITIVGLKSIAADLGGERSVPALAYSLAWLGAFVGGIAMGQAAERFGVRATVIFGSLMIATGSAAGAKRQRHDLAHRLRALFIPGRVICHRVEAKIMCRCSGCCFRTGREWPVSGARLIS